MRLPPGMYDLRPTADLRPLALSLESIAVRIFHDSGDDPKLAVENAKTILALAAQARKSTETAAQVDAAQFALDQLNARIAGAEQTLNATRDATRALRETLGSVIDAAAARVRARKAADEFKAALLAEWRKRLEELLKEKP